MDRVIKFTPQFSRLTFHLDNTLRVCSFLHGSIPFQYQVLKTKVAKKNRKQRFLAKFQNINT